MTEKTIQIHCNACVRKTSHNVLASADAYGEHGEEHRTDTYQTLQCTCGHVTFRKQELHSAWQDGDPDSAPLYKHTFYPPPIFQAKPTWISQLDEKLVEVLDEVYSAIQHDLRFIAAVGIRTALDMMMVEKVDDLDNNKAKYCALKEKGFVTDDELIMLTAVIDAGDATAHRGYKPDTIDLKRALDIAESILEKVYVAKKNEKQLQAKARKLTSKVPPRRKKV